MLQKELRKRTASKKWWWIINKNIIQTNQNEIPNQEVDDISDFFGHDKSE